MSLFVAGFWIPSSIQFGTTFLDTGLNFVDSFGAALLSTLFSGIQLCMSRRIFQLRLRLLESKKHRRGVQYLHALLLTLTSIGLTGLFFAASFIYCIQFSRNVLSLRSVDVPRSSSEDPGDLVWACLSGPTDLIRCIVLPLENLLDGRRMELAYAGIVQTLIFTTDLLLVLRCYFIFTDKPYVYMTAVLSFLASIGVSLFGLISLSKAGGLSPASSWNWSQKSTPTLLPPGFSPSMSIVSSLIVNSVVTISIVWRMLVARRRLKDSLPILHGGGKDDVYETASVILTESALPPVVFGIVASIFSSQAVTGGREGLFEFHRIPKVAWLSFTVLAPQLILVRILQGRAWKTGTSFLGNEAMHSTQATMPITFRTPRGSVDSSSSSSESEGVACREAKKRVGVGLEGTVGSTL